MKKAIDIFGEWAEQGKDVGMENTHAMPVKEMIDFALEEREKIGKNFSFLDLGCGNGWVVRDVANNILCGQSVGIDGAKQMIANAESRGGDTKYILADINSFDSDDQYDVIHSMEVLYYLDDPLKTVKKITDSWLSNNGRLIVGVDHYYENADSHSWQKEVGTRMLMLKESEWVNIFEMAGLNEVKSWRSGKDKDWAGTLAVSYTHLTLPTKA